MNAASEATLQGESTALGESSGAEIVSIFGDEIDALIGGPSALDRPLNLTLFTGVKDRGKSEKSYSLRELATRVHRPERDVKSELPMIKLARFGDDPGAGKAVRNDANMRFIDGIEGDHDRGTLSLAGAATLLRRARIAALLYTSASHTPDTPRWRVMVPISKSLLPAERDRLCARLNGVLGGALAPESFALSQSYFYGRVRDGAAPELEVVDGRFIDNASELDVIAVGKGQVTAQTDKRDRSAVAYGMACELKRVGGTVDDFRAKLAEDPVLAEWAKDERQLLRAWERAAATPLADWFEDLVEPAAATATKQLTILTPADCEESPHRGYIVKGLIAPRDVACIYGAPGAGKSLIAPYIGYQVALGSRAFDMRTKQGVVLYIPAEDPEGLRGRIKALRAEFGDAPDFKLIEGVSNLLEPRSPDLAALRNLVAELRPTLIILDTLAAAFPGLEENTAEAMGQVIHICRSLTEHGAAVCLIHHDTKAQTPTPRGHSVLNGALDVALQLFPRDEDAIVKGKLSKNRNGSCDRKIAFRVALQDRGLDEDGDPIRLPYVSVLTGPMPKREKLAPSAQAALAVLSELKTLGSIVTEAEWRIACVDGRKVSPAEDRRSRAKAFTRAKGDVIRAGMVDVRDGHVLTRTELEPNDFDDAAL